MNKIWLIGLCLIYMLRVDGASVKKVTYDAQEQSHTFQIGKLELFFDQNPPIEIKKMRLNSGEEQLNLLLGAIDMKADYTATINGIQGHGYRVAVHNTGPKRSIVVTYDPNVILVTCTPLISINMEYGMAVRFFDQELIRNVSKQEKPILYVASL